jgi:hypothetical protein
MKSSKPRRGTTRPAAPTFTRDDLYAELAGRHVTRQREDGDITAREYAARYGVCYVTARYRLNALVDLGVMERVERVEVVPGARLQTVWRRKV